MSDRTQDDVAAAFQRGVETGRELERAAQIARETAERAEREAARTRIPPRS